MRGERATLGKSLLDVERELRIKASFVAAIENADPDAFDTPGFIPGYVRSYARYLGMDPDEAFAGFCAESGFSTAHGMSAAASSVRRDAPVIRKSPRRDQDPLVAPSTPFIPANESMFSRIEPGAIGSLIVLVALVGAIGYGGWKVLDQVQQVRVAPVENTPDVLAELDPLDSAVARETDESAGQAGDTVAGVFASPQEDALDRLYRPEALDVPVLVARDAPISTLSPAQVGTLRPMPQDDSIATAQAEADEGLTHPGLSGIDAALAAAQGTTPQVLAEPEPGVQMVAVRPAWVRVRAADGTVIYETIMNAGDTYDVPVTETPPSLRVGESGAIYFRVNGQHYGPVGPRGSVTANLALDAGTLAETYEVADLTQDADLERYVAELEQPRN
nr:RodZ domain-containing protein [Roseovarius sp. SCSIO 43702]